MKRVLLLTVGIWLCVFLVVQAPATSMAAMRILARPGSRPRGHAPQVTCPRHRSDAC
jgi:hypothetical protein